MKTQSEMILEHLKQGNKISPIEALNKFGCFRLGARIFDLKEQGHNIRSEMVTQDGKTFAVYSMPTKVESNGQMVLI